MSKDKPRTLKPIKPGEYKLTLDMVQIFSAGHDQHFSLMTDGSIREAFTDEDGEGKRWLTGDLIIHAHEAAEVLEERPVVRQWRASMKKYSEALEELRLQRTEIDRKMQALQQQRNVIITKMESVQCPDEPEHLVCTDGGYDIQHDADRIGIGCMDFSELTARKLTAIMVAQAKKHSRRKR